MARKCDIEKEAQSTLLKSCATVYPPDKNLQPNKKLSVTTRNIAPAGVSIVQWMPDFARKYYVRSGEPPNMIALLNTQKVSSLQSAAKFKTKQELQAEIDERIKQKDDRLKRNSQLREELQAWDAIRKENRKLSKLDDEAKKEMEFLCRKAKEAALEREEDIKEINNLLLSATVQTIRDSQVREKEYIKLEHKNAELGLDEMMEKERLESIEKAKAADELRQKKIYEAAGILKEQIKHNAELRLLEQDQKARDGIEMLKWIETEQQKDFTEFAKRKSNQRMLLKELIEENAAVLKHKNYLKEESRREDFKLAEYQRIKAAEEDEKEEEERERKRKRDLEISKLAEKYMGGYAVLAELEALRIRRQFEEKERKTRKMEKEKIIKEKEVQESLRKSRQEQLEAQERLRRQMAERDQKQVEAQFKKMKEEEAEEDHVNMLRRLNNLQYSEEIREQIRRKEKEKITERKQFFLEGVHLQQEQQKRNEMIDYVKRSKIKKMQELDIPNAYLAHIRRKIQITEK